MSCFLQWTDFPEVYDKMESLSDFIITPDIQKLDSHHFIEGDNYPVLKKLCQKGFEEQVNLIYIDPPYNTGNDFVYNDDFSSSSDRHSAWLSFMQRRLLLAKQLLKSDGCIFIAIDKSELYYLKILCDSVFGEENFINDFSWLHGKGKKDTWSRTLQQHTLCYAKDKNFLKPFREVEYSSWATKNTDNDPRGNWFSGSISFSEKRSSPAHRNYYEIVSPSGVVWKRQWQVSKTEMDNLISQNLIYWGNAPKYNSVPRKKIFNNTPTEVIPKNIIDCVETTRAAEKKLEKLLNVEGVFDNPKPVSLISHLIEITQMSNDAVIMDFFAGSGTTYEAVCELNKKDGGKRKAILVQKPELINSKNTELPSDLKTISDICKKRLLEVEKIYPQEAIIFHTGK